MRYNWCCCLSSCSAWKRIVSMISVEWKIIFSLCVVVVVQWKINYFDRFLCCARWRWRESNYDIPYYTQYIDVDSSILFFFFRSVSSVTFFVFLLSFLCRATVNLKATKEILFVWIIWWNEISFFRYLSQCCVHTAAINNLLYVNEFRYDRRSMMFWTEKREKKWERKKCIVKVNAENFVLFDCFVSNWKIVSLIISSYFEVYIIHSVVYL